MEDLKLHRISADYLQDKQADSLPPLMEALDDYMAEIKEESTHMPAKLCRDILLSEYNYRIRSKLKSCRSFGLTVYAGDICYIDFGRAYVTEAGYQHFGLVITVSSGKALVVLMTSNPVNYSMAYDPDDNPNGLRHLMRLGRVEGMYKYSVLFLNDAKFINTARIIDMKSWLDPESEKFRQIVRRLFECMSMPL